MTREEIINRKKEIAVETAALDLRNNSTRSKVWKHFKALCIENSNLQREFDKLDGKTYDCEKWITKFIGNSYESLKAARFDLINQIKDLHGVEVGEEKSGVVGVTVYTEYKIYYYTIHAHYRVEIVKEWEENTPFGKTTRQETRNIYQAWCENNGFGWSWRY